MANMFNMSWHDASGGLLCACTRGCGHLFCVHVCVCMVRVCGYVREVCVLCVCVRVCSCACVYVCACVLAWCYPFTFFLNYDGALSTSPL